MDAQLRAGIAIFNAGMYHPAHDAWEARWLDLETGTDDERFLHGLIQYTAAVHHGTDPNWAGLQGLAESAVAYLDGLESPYRGVDLETVRAYLRRLAADPAHIERAPPPPLRYRGRAIDLSELGADGEFAAVAVAARVLAEEHPEYDADVIEAAVGWAESAIEADEGSQYAALLIDFLDAEKRALVYDRLESHVQRRRRREESVDGLFE